MCCVRNRGEVVPLNPEEWTAGDDGDGLIADEFEEEGAIDLLEDEEEQQQKEAEHQQQRGRSGGRRRAPLYDAAAGDGDDSQQVGACLVACLLTSVLMAIARETTLCVVCKAVGQFAEDT